MEKPNQIKIQFELDKDVAQGTYSNFQTILFSEAEFIIDFARTMPHSPVAKVNSRIILTPRCAKSLYYSLKNNIEKYEKDMGEIPFSEKNTQTNIGFKVVENKE